MEKCSIICFVTNIVMGAYCFFFITIGFTLGNTLAKLIIQSIFLFMVLLTNICAIIEIALNNSLFELTGYFPNYLLNTVNEMINSSGPSHFWPFFPLLIINIIFCIIYAIKFHKEKSKDTKDNQKDLDAGTTMLQFISNGMIEKKKYELNFDFGHQRNQEI